jgi:microsomal dipeptidase-like Zn-dependent dipeptidase
MKLPARVSAASLLVGLAAVGCLPFQVPGLGPLLGPPEQLDPEPAQCGVVNDRVPESKVCEPIVGAADFHIHQFSNLGFGGRVVWGHSFHREGVQAALSSCGADKLCTDKNEAMICRNVICRFSGDVEACQAACERTRCATSPPHGHLGLTDPVGAVLGQGKGHRVHGYPDFHGWPHYNTFTHQQVYHRWLRRAFDGGLKLIVMLAVTNEVLCKFLGHDHPCDDMTNVDLQLQAAHDLEAYVDRQNDCSVNGNGWYRIAESPTHAREIIASGGMAVVLGIEVDSLFDCYKRGSCTLESVRQKIDRYRARKVRHVFPIHLFDNAFGGAAVYKDFFNFGNAVVNQELFKVHDCSAQGYEFRFGKASGAVDDFLGSVATTLGVPYPRYADLPAHCNSQGLTDLGTRVVSELMQKKMIIDVDHMSARARKQVLDMAQQRKYAGLVSGHSGFLDLYSGLKRAEGELRGEDVKQLLGLGGLLAPILHHGSRDLLSTYPRQQGTKVTHDCGNSAKSFAQGYLYAIDAMKQANREPAVGFGSDLNGLAGMPAPRFGPYACEGDVGAPQSGQVAYPIRVFPGVGDYALEASKAGHRRFDINVDGYAHAGMFPDFVAELRAIGLTQQDLTPLFSSAEAYIALWEKVEGTKRPDCQPRATAATNPPPP